MLQGLVDFARVYQGRLWVEVMLVKGVNDSPAELTSIKRAVDKVRPDRVYILTPIRPPAESWVIPPDLETIIEAQTVIGQATVVSEIESGEFSLQKFENTEEAIMEIGSRHPLRLDQAKSIESHFSETGTVERMLGTKSLIKVTHASQVYVLPSRFVRSR
jgi:wyosine [tRNA(Phe)-imidazoG37] synthetase (radical SAM superfamily)